MNAYTFLFQCNVYIYQCIYIYIYIYIYNIKLKRVEVWYKRTIFKMKLYVYTQFITITTLVENTY